MSPTSDSSATPAGVAPANIYPAPRSRWIAIGLAAFTATMIAALIFGLNAGTRLGNRYTPLLDAVFHVKLNVTTAHLWFEEALSGDTNESINDVRAYLDVAERFVRFSLTGQRIDKLPLTLLSEPDLRAAFTTLHRYVGELQEITEERWELLREARAGTESDARYDHLFRRIISLADEIEAGLEFAVIEETENFRRVQIALIVASSGLFVFTLWLIRRQIFALRAEIEQRRRTEEELKRSEAAALAARDEADAANQAKSLFLAKISHEIRTPISAIMGMATMLSDSALDAEQCEYTRIVHTSSNDLLEIINDLLDFSKIEAGKLTLAPVTFDLRKTVADIADLMNLKPRQNDVLISPDIPPSFPEQVIGDPVRIRQVILNLVRNAIKFTSQGWIVVSLQGEPGRGDRMRVRLTVSDTGIGIPRDKLEHIFEAFSQVDDTSTRHFGGTGLGLSICRQLTDLMQGSMGVESESGRGARFWVELPLGIARADPTPALLSAQSPVRVLLADPDPDNARDTARYLDHLGATHEIVREPGLVLESLLAAAAAERAYACVIVSEPFEGLEIKALCNSIRADSRLSTIGILILARRPAPGLIRKFADCGVNGIGTQAQRALILPDLLQKVVDDAGAPSGELVLSGALADVSGDRAKPRRQFKARVLLVEDNPVTQWAAKHLLLSMGCRVDVAASGEDALAAWQDRRFDLIFMDWQMPDMDGIEVTRRIREQEPPGTRTPIVAITANAMRGDRETCLDAGMDDYLSKPVRPDELERVLESFATEFRGPRTANA